MADKPFLSAAFLCEKVLRETDDVLTAVRIVDTFYVSVPKDLPVEIKPTIQMTVFLSFVRVSATNAGKHQALIRVYKPSGAPLGEDGPLKLDLVFREEGVAKCNLIISLGLGIQEFGQHRIDVSLDDKLVTKIPFRLLERPEPAKTVQ